ncbi:MAG: cold shock domain-containing protein [Anaerolineae bacterium]
MHPGVVKWFSMEKGFGFIVQVNGSEVFFHKSNVVGDLHKVGQDGAHVWYELRQTRRGPEAYNVHLRE